MEANPIRGAMVIMGIVLSAGAAAPGGPGPQISIVTDADPGPGARHGLAKLQAALAARSFRCERLTSLAGARGQFIVLAGLAGAKGPAAERLKANGAPLPEGPEALVIRHISLAGRKGLLVVGVVERAVSKFTFHPGVFEKQLFDERYWERYFDLLARNRFDTFVLVFGYENGGYFAPPYPYFFDLPEFPDVRVVGSAATSRPSSG